MEQLSRSTWPRYSTFEGWNMMTLKKMILSACGLMLLSSCMTLNDEWIDLGDGYTFHQDGKWRSIYPNQSYYQTQIYSQIIDYKFDNKFIIAIQKPDKKHYLIFTSSDYSSRYFIYKDFLSDSTSKTFYEETTSFIRQSIKADSSLYKMLKSKGITEKNQEDDQEKLKLFIDSIFRTDPFYIHLFSSNENYWIINKDKNVRFGPFTKREFSNECRLQGIRLSFDVK